MSGAQWIETPHGGYTARLLEDGVVRVCGPGGTCQIVKPDGRFGARCAYGRLPLSVMGVAMELMGR